MGLIYFQGEIRKQNDNSYEIIGMVNRKWKISMKIKTMKHFEELNQFFTAFFSWFLCVFVFLRVFPHFFLHPSPAEGEVLCPGTWKIVNFFFLFFHHFFVSPLR